MRIGSQNLNLGVKPAAPQGPADAGAAPGARVIRDALTLSGVESLGWMKGLKLSFQHLVDRLLHRQKPPRQEATEPRAAQPATAQRSPEARPAPVGVRAQAEELWFKAHELKSSFRQGIRDAHDVNDRNRGRDRQADALITANAPLEAERLAAWSPQQAESYQALQTALADQPQARLALQVLLADGKLTAKPAATDGKDLLGSLRAIVDQKLAPGIDRTTFLGELIHEIAVPSAINQQDKATCTVASVQILMAMQSPAEYARVAAGLATPEGKVKLAGGQTVTREPGTEADDGSHRTASSRLWQAAFMQFAVGPDVDYDNDRDDRSDGKWGIFGAELDRVVDALSNRDTPLLMVDDRTTGAEVVEAIAKHVRAGKPVPVCMDWGEKDESGNTHDGHDILVTAIEDGRVIYNNPWGYQESMSLKEFETRVWWANPVEFKQ